MKKVISLSLILIILISLLSNVNAVAKCEVDLQIAQNEFRTKDEFEVEVRISNIQDEKGIFGVSATLDYDKESLEYIGMEEQAGWGESSYDDGTKVMILLRDSDYATTDQTACKIKFRIKETSKQDISIALKEVTASNGDDDIPLEEKIKDVTVIDGTPNIKLPDPTEPETPDPAPEEPTIPTPSNPEQTEGENTTNTSTSGNTANRDIPYAGENDGIAVAFVIGGFILLATALFIKIKVIDK